MAQTGSSGAFKVGGLLMKGGAYIFAGTAAPTNAVTGAGKAGPGSLYLCTGTGVVYVNTNTKASPTWSQSAGLGGVVVYSPSANTSLFNELAQTGITANATQTQAAATPITGQMALVSTVAAAGNGIVLPASAAGLEIFVINKGANPMQVYGLSADKIDDQTASVGVVQMAGSAVIYACAAAGNWYSEGLATGFGGPGLQTFSFTPTITAAATQTQAAATVLTTMINRVGTSAASGNGVALPASVVGLAITIINRGAQPIQVYGNNTAADTINGIATGTGVSQGINTSATYVCDVAGNWEVPITSLVSTQPTTLSVNGAIPPHTAHTYVITKAGVLADTLAAPTATTDDGLEITIVNTTANAHTLTATGLLKTGSAAVNVATFNPFAGASLTLMAYQALWYVIAANGISFS